MRPRPDRPTIHKFGGAALADAAGIRRTLTIFQAQPGARVMVVSAVSGMTDLLASAVEAACAGDTTTVSVRIETFRERHLALGRDLDLPGDAPWAQTVAASTADLIAVLDRIQRSGTATPAQQDQVISRGELLSAALMGDLLAAAGVPVTPLAATDLIVTQGPFRDAVPDQVGTRAAVMQHLIPVLVRGRVPLVPGFIGRGPGGELMTLGRGGSDLTAALLGRATDAEAVVLWKDVPGLLTADPRVVPEARLLARAHRLEASELAWYGAKVLHPRALAPLTGTRIPVHLRPFGDPASAGTIISAAHQPDQIPVRGLAAIRDQTLLTITGSGVMGIPGVAARLFAALQVEDIPITLVTQASAEAAIDCTVATAHAARAVELLRRTLREDIRRGEIDGVERRDGMGIIAVVGLGMAQHPGVAARLFEATAATEVNVVAIAQGAGERNISLVLEDGDVPAGLRAIHAAFQLDKIDGGRPLRREGRDVILLGAGTIGRSVLQLIHDHPVGLPTLRLVAVLDSRGGVINAEGLDRAALAAIMAAKANGGRLHDLPGGCVGTPDDLLTLLIDRALVRPILVDLTASETSPLLLRAATAGWDLVLANKRPLAAPAATVTALRDTLARTRSRLRHEATVGAGLPILEALQQLLATGDRIRSLEGCLSGTLGVVLSALQRGVPFSEAVRSARAAGYTEPDPRDDLGGLDVARKALILARAIGVAQELEALPIDSLVLSGHDLPTEAWLANLPSEDAIWQDRVRTAGETGKVLRYVATVTPNQVTVGLRALPGEHPLANLDGAANQLVIRSDRYHDAPLVITGPGAGPAVTATGVLADLLALR